MRRAALTIVATVALLLGACGDGQPDDGGPLTEEEFVAAADRICSNYAIATEKKTGEILGGDPDSEPDENEARVLAAEVIVPGLGQLADATEELIAPEQIQPAVDEYLAALRASISSAENDPSGYFTDGDGLSDASAAAERLGLSSCGG